MTPSSSVHRIILSDDHAAVRLGTRILIERDPRFTIIAEASNGNELLEKVKTQPCDIVITDLSMPGMDGLEAIRRLRSERSKIKILVYTMHSEKSCWVAVLEEDVDAYILKGEDLTEIPVALESILAGKKYVSPGLLQNIGEAMVGRLMHEKDISSLSAREKEILRHVARGLESRAVAEALGISRRTVEVHRSNILRKLGLKNVAEMVRFAMDTGIV